MKKIVHRSILSSFATCMFLFAIVPAKAQDNAKVVASFPDDVNRIISHSCIPCHSDKGRTLSKSKLNFDAWETYTPEKQKQKAQKMYYEIKKDKMPPKAAREKHPEIIPTSEQVAVIKNWSETYSPKSK